MKKALQTFCFFLALSFASYAADTPVTFTSAIERERYEALLEELRCLVCQNQSLSDSHADLAQDLRDQVYAMVVEGKDNVQIVQFMVERYGDFVLYKPPVKSATWFLWFGPLILLVVAFAIVVIFARRHTRGPRALSKEEQNQVQMLLTQDQEP
ncbi:MAG TPA: cytochrome c-type biogenesis protein CcmH [Gammaproteobacteria bacterium]|nr:cytochrome c-type biogenesis protein CcmH [Gammaproteobacteria bacterium]